MTTREQPEARTLHVPRLPGEEQEWPPARLAYIGDAVFELIVRTTLAARFDEATGALHARSIQLVSARAQAEALRTIEAELTETELRWLKKGRNVRPHSQPRHADAVDYRLASGLETLFGYLYLTGRTERLETLIEIILKAMQYGERQNQT